MFKIILIVLAAVGNPADMPDGWMPHRGDIVYESAPIFADENTCWAAWNKLKPELDAMLRKHHVSIRYLPECEEAL